jgi:predicted nucleic acid-binding protein
LDTSVFINFLAIDQGALLLRHPGYQFILTDHVRHEVTDLYPEQCARLDSLLEDKAILQIRVDSPEELEIFAALSILKRFGTGECAAIAAAVHRGCAIAIDDKSAANYVRRTFPGVRIETTQSIVIGLIKGGLLSVSHADGFKARWERDYRFRLPIRSFKDALYD